MIEEKTTYSNIIWGLKVVSKTKEDDGRLVS